MTHRRAAVSRVQSHVLGLLSQPLFNILEYLCYGFYVVDIGRSDPHIHHNAVLAVHGSMFAATEAVRLAFLMQLPAFRVAFADLPGRRAIIVILLVEGLLARFLDPIPELTDRNVNMERGRKKDELTNILKKPSASCRNHSGQPRRCTARKPLWSRHAGS